MLATLILENGKTFYGNAFGDVKEAVGEVVFNTGMTGYQEVLTDPSYYGQIVTMTYPLIGNYGLNLEDLESERPKVRAFIVREKCSTPSNWRSEISLEAYLKNNGIMGIEGIDTRALTKILRNHGTMRGIITTKNLEYKDVQGSIEAFTNKEAVKTVSTEQSYIVEGSGKNIAILDFGVKRNIINSFKRRNCNIKVYPYNTSSEEILAQKPDMVFLSNGPGDPMDLPMVIENIKKLIGVIPLSGICLGHQLLCLALGGKTERLKFGHRGGNHPVKDLEKDKVFITSQNHGYYVKDVPEDVNVTHINVNDGTVEGMRHKSLPVFSVQFHPEASPGPVDNDYIFDEFLKLID